MSKDYAIVYRILPSAFPQQLATSQISKVKRQGWRIYLIHNDQVLGIGESAPWVGFGAGEKEVKEELGHIRQDQQLLEVISTLVEKSKLESLVVELGQEKVIKDRLVTLKLFRSCFKAHKYTRSSFCT